MTLESSKNMGGIGALLIVIGFLGGIGYGYAGILSLVGLILMLIGMKGFADHYREAGIFNNALYAVILTIVGVVVFVAVIFVVLFTMLFSVLPPGFDWTNPGAFTQLFTDFTLLFQLLGGIIAALVVLFVFAIISAIFFRKSLSTLAAKTGVHMFETAGLLLLIGAVLTIIVVGLILIWIAFILVTVAFFSVRPEAAAPAPAPPPPQTS